MIILEENDSAVETCVEFLNKKGNVLLLPTETVYGLVCSWTDEEAKAKIYALKHRSGSKLLGTFLPGTEEMNTLLPDLPETAGKLAAAFCPGPITLVVPDGQSGTFGFRIPAHRFMLKVAKRFGKILAQTSANLSGTPAALSVQEAMSTLCGEPDLAVDGGKIAAGSLSSTVVMVRADSSWSILRKGAITQEKIKEVLA